MRRNRHAVESDDYKIARSLRRKSSPIENKFWFALRAASAGQKIKFRRQQPIHPYIADFACMRAKLLVELDGFSHDCSPEKDAERDKYLNRQGYIVLRINNRDVTQNLDSVVAMVICQAKQLMNNKIHAPSPAKTKGLLRKPGFSLPLPQGERRN